MINGIKGVQNAKENDLTVGDDCDQQSAVMLYQNTCRYHNRR